MKKIIAMAMAAMLICAFSATAFAAGSVDNDDGGYDEWYQEPETPATTPSAPVETPVAPTAPVTTAPEGTTAPTTATEVNPGDVTVSATVTDAAAVADVNSIKDTGIESFLESKGIAETVNTVLAAAAPEVKTEDLKAHAFFEVATTGKAAAAVEKDGYVNVSFSVSGIQPGDVAVVLGFDGTNWVVCPATVSADGKTVTTRLGNISSVMILTGAKAANYVAAN